MTEKSPVALESKAVPTGGGVVLPPEGDYTIVNLSSKPLTVYPAGEQIVVAPGDSVTKDQIAEAAARHTAAIRRGMLGRVT